VALWPLIYEKLLLADKTFPRDAHQFFRLLFLTPGREDGEDPDEGENAQENGSAIKAK